MITTTSEPLCRWCGKPRAEHLASRPDSAPVPRVPCLGLRAHFVGAEPKREPEDAPAPAWDSAAWEELPWG